MFSNVKIWNETKGKQNINIEIFSLRTYQALSNGYRYIYLKVLRHYFVNNIQSKIVKCKFFSLWIYIGSS